MRGLPAILLLAAQGAFAQPPAEDVATKAERTMRAPSIETPLGPVETPMPLELAKFLLDHPEIAAFITHRHRIAPYRITPRGAGSYWADDGEGTKGLITLYGESGKRRSYFSDGVHDSEVLPPIHATAVVMMDLEEAGSGGCRPSVRASFQVYVKLKSQVLSSLAKTVRVFVRKKVARIFAKAFLAADKVGRLMAEDPEGLARELDTYPSIDPAVKAEFRELLGRFKRGRASCS